MTMMGYNALYYQYANRAALWLKDKS